VQSISHVTVQKEFMQAYFYGNIIDLYCTGVSHASLQCNTEIYRLLLHIYIYIYIYIYACVCVCGEIKECIFIT
jgi:hypothetical protein